MNVVIKFSFVVATSDISNHFLHLFLNASFIIVEVSGNLDGVALCDNQST